MKVISHMTPAVAALYAGVAQAHPANAINEGASSFLAQFHAHPHGIGLLAVGCWLLAIASVTVLATTVLGVQSIKQRAARDKR
jgi:hypothetical protein